MPYKVSLVIVVRGLRKHYKVHERPPGVAAAFRSLFRRTYKTIAAVDGVDVIHVGANDLLTNMGKPGQFGDPEIMAAIDKVIAAAGKHGKFAGVGGDRHVERQVGFIRNGARFLTTQTDVGLLLAEAMRVTGELRRALAK